MTKALLSLPEVNRMINTISHEWLHGSLFFKRKRIRQTVAALRKDFVLNDTDLFVLLFSFMNHEKSLNDISLCKLIIGDTIGTLLSILRLVEDSQVNPYRVWFYLRDINKPLALSDFNIEAQRISILLEAIALLSAAEGSRTDAQIKGAGVVRSWKCAAKQGIEVSNALFKVEPGKSDSPCMDIAAKIIERATAVMSLDEEVEKRNERYRFVSTDDGSYMPVVFVPYEWEPALADKHINETAYRQLVDDLGLRELYLKWLAALGENIA